MTTQEPDRGQALRLWPGVVAVVLQWVGWVVVPMLDPNRMIYAIFAGIFGGGAIVLVWWLAFSRAPHLERWGILALAVVGAFATWPFLDKSIAGGMMGLMFKFFAVPTLCLGLVLGAVIGARFSVKARRIAMAIGVLAGSACWTVMRTNGITGEGKSQYAFRWTKTDEEKLLARTDPVPAPVTPAAASEKKLEAPAEVASSVRPAAPAKVPAPAKAAPVAPVARRAEPEWPGFRGRHRDDIVTGVRIRTDWASAPPKEVWRRPVGPGWSSFAVSDGLIYTQEQRGDFEMVSCYRAATGQPVWSHRDAARFYESNGGAGPRGTPTLHEGRVYTFGATGIVNALDADTGTVIWTHNAGADTGAKVPEWGFTSSPLVVGDEVIVAASGRMAAYDLATGNLRWHMETGAGSYSSPHLVKSGGVDQVVLLSGVGATGISPGDGKILWKYAWKGVPIIQPAATPDGILLSVDDSSGTRRLALEQSSGGWSAKEMWTSMGLKPYFNDIVIHKGYAYGFDGAILSCIDLADGKRKWKGGRYGHGQLLLLADQDLLLVTTEEGEIALASATPDQFNEVAKIPAIEGKTWNHPVVAQGMLFMRNGQEMVAFRLPVESASGGTSAGGAERE